MAEQVLQARYGNLDVGFSCESLVLCFKWQKFISLSAFHFLILHYIYTPLYIQENKVELHPSYQNSLWPQISTLYFISCPQHHIIKTLHLCCSPPDVPSILSALRLTDVSHIFHICLHPCFTSGGGDCIDIDNIILYLNIPLLTLIIVPCVKTIVPIYLPTDLI